jgi:hypothetical protein
MSIAIIMYKIIISQARNSVTVRNWNFLNYLINVKVEFLGNILQ